MAGGAHRPKGWSVIGLSLHKGKESGYPSRMGQKRIHLVVRGRVQGVYFRASTQREAKRLGLTGWVKNRDDGGVEIVAEGEEDQVKDLLVWSQHGPSTARVEEVDTRWRSYTGEYSEFKIVPEG
jgi:acylphosphatase